MADERKGVVAAGFSLLWRRQGVLWWVFVVNFICGGLGAMPAIVTLNRALGHSMAGEKLTKGFDLSMLEELTRLPYINLMRQTVPSYIMALFFLLFMLFVAGGILETYRQDKRLTAGEFFGSSGAFFWRFVRLALLSIVPFVIVAMVYQGLSKIADKVGDRAIADQVGIFLSLAAFIIFLLLALWVRLWFDIAQVRAVVLSERGMWRNTWRAWRLTWRNLRHLYRVYICVSVVALVVLILGLVVWAHLGPTNTLLSFLVLEVIIFAQLMTRLWQLSSAMTWYQRNPEPVPVEIVEVAPEIAQETVVAEPIPPTAPIDPGPELPPADA
jgi:fumarate reductase subunit C